MRKSLGLIVGLVSLCSAACGGAIDRANEDGTSSASASALRDPNVIIPPDPTAHPVQKPLPTPIRVILDPPSQGPWTVIPPAPAPVLSMVSGWAGFAGAHGHDDGSFATTFGAPSLVAAVPSGFTWVLDQDSDLNLTSIRTIQPSRGTSLPHVSTLLRQSDTNVVALFAMGGIAADPDTLDLYATDTQSNTIVKITKLGQASVVAGMSGSSPFYADGTGAVARFAAPAGIARAANGTFYVADTNNRAIRIVTTNGTVSKMAQAVGGTFFPKAIAIDPRDGSAYVTVGNAIYAVSTAGAITLYAGDVSTAGFANGAASSALFNAPTGLAVDRSGNVYVAEPNNKAIRKIVASVAGSAVTVETVPTLAPVNPQSTGLDGYGTDDNVLDSPTGLAFTGDRLVFTDATRPTVRIAN